MGEKRAGIKLKLHRFVPTFRNYRRVRNVNPQLVVSMNEEENFVIS